MRRLLLTSLATFAAFGCGNDRIVRRTCPETRYEMSTQTTTTTTTQTATQSGFDIEHVSVLEATDQLYGGADAVIIDHDALLPLGATWRVSSVDVLVMVNDFDFSGYPQSVGTNQVWLTVQVWDADSPNLPSKPAYEVRQQLAVNQLTWETVTLSTGRWHKAWWSFPFVTPTSAVIPQSGLTAPKYLVGVKWDRSAEPQIGYSNFNRPCDRNWTNTTGSQWVLNSTLGNSTPNECNWPMLRVNTEVLTQVTTTVETPVVTPVTVMVERDVCDPNAVDMTTVLDGGVDDAGTP